VHITNSLLRFPKTVAHHSFARVGGDAIAHEALQLIGLRDINRNRSFEEPDKGHPGFQTSGNHLIVNPILVPLCVN
jgi:hypothetical protein